jgi:hypothetical protein
MGYMTGGFSYIPHDNGDTSCLRSIYMTRRETMKRLWMAGQDDGPLTLRFRALLSCLLHRSEED